MFSAIKAAFKLLTLKQKREYWLVAIILSFTSIADLVGIAAIIPAISALIDFQGAVGKGYLHKLFVFLGQPEETEFIIIITSGAIGFIWGAAILTTLGVFARQRFVRRLSADISTRSYSYYMSQSIEPFYKRPSSEFLRNVNGISERVATGIIDASFVMISRSVQLCVIAALLMTFNIGVTLFIFSIISSAYFLVYSLIKKKLKRMSSENFESHRQLNQKLSGSYADYRNIHIDDRLRDYIKTFKEIKTRTSKKSADIEVLGTIPRNFIEVLGMTLLLTAAYYLGKTAEDSHQLLTTISLFAIAAYKILPAAQQIYHAVSKATGAAVVFDKVKNEWQTLALNHPEMASASQVVSFNYLELKSLSYAHCGSEWVVHDFSAFIKLKGIVRITGPSGAGKTTLIELLAGLRAPQCGSIYIDNSNLDNIPRSQWWASIAYVNQSGYLLEGAILDNVVGHSTNVDKKHYQLVSEVCGLESLPVEMIAEGATNLSGGQKCRVLIARALYKKAQLLFLDETLSPLDVDSAKAILHGIRAEFPSVCIFVISHRNEELDDDYQELAVTPAATSSKVTMSSNS